MNNELNVLSKRCHEANIKWWLDLSKRCPNCLGDGIHTILAESCSPAEIKCIECKGLGYALKERNTAELLMLIVSELSEALEGHRKDLMDDKLPHRKMFEVELADVLVRVFDLAGGYGLDLDGAFEEKMLVNATRADHKIENRLKAGGKKY